VSDKQCEANIYIGVSKSIEQQGLAARPALQRASETCGSIVLELPVALSELRNLK
jgi:hypothetical protein